MSRRFRLRCSFARSLAILVLIWIVGITGAPAQLNNECDLPGEEPDVVVSNIYETKRWGRVGDITGFSVGTYSCNYGDCWLNWISETNEHPVISGNMYRLLEGKFEQIGQSWLKHGFFALSGDLCGGGCISTDGNHLGVLCSDPYSAFLNGEQDRLGPKFEVNPHTGVFPYPATDLFLEGNAIYKRLQVHNDDLDPLLNPGAQYFVDSQYITADDAAAGNQNNNASYRPVNVTGSAGTYDLSLTGSTQQEMPGIIAWVDSDPGVQLTTISVPQDGLLFLAAKVTSLGGGMWHYEYAIQNLNSHRGAREFSMPVLPGANVVNIGFHDVEYHSGEPFDGTDWPGIVEDADIPNRIVWKTDTFTMNPDANALRWDSLYNFRFDVDLPPVPGAVTLGLFRTGFPETVLAQTLIPAQCNENSTCDPGEDMCICTNDCIAPPTETSCTDGIDNDCDRFLDCIDPDCCAGNDCDTHDGDHDGVAICDDCADRNPGVWHTPGEVPQLGFRAFFSIFQLFWDPADPLGSPTVDYEVLRSGNTSDLMTDPTCLQSPDPTSLTYYETDDPAPDPLFYYLIRATNDCPVGEGSTGMNSEDERVVASCP